MLKLGPPLTEERLVDLGVPLVAHRGSAVRVRARWLVSGFACAIGLVAVTAGARARGREVEVWVPIVIIGLVAFVFFGMHLARVVRLNDLLGDEATLVGWCLGGFEVSELITRRDLAAVGRVSSAVVGVFATKNGVVIAVDRSGTEPWLPLPPDTVRIGTNGSRRWLLLTAGGRSIEQRLFPPVQGKP